MVKRSRMVFVNGLLLAGLMGLLAFYLIALNDLPSRIYTPTQREFLRYNASRKISQLAPTWNILEAGGDQAGTITTFPGQESRVRATLKARYEEQEGVSATLYDLDFRGEYRLAHPGPTDTAVELVFPFPNNLETLHDVRFLVDGEEPPQATYTTTGITWATVLEAGVEHEISISYKADGANSFGYALHHNQRSDVDISVTVLGLKGSQVPKVSLPPSATEVEDDGETFTWKYSGLIADRDIQLALPAHLSFTQRLARLNDEFRLLAGLAPLLVGLFLAALAGVLHLSGQRLRLESYLLIGLSLALFYPLLTFLSGMVGVFLASILALCLVSALLLAFLSLMLGWPITRWRVGLLLAIFLGVFSLGMLTPWRGLLLTGGGLSLIGIFMILYARRPVPTEPETVPLPVETEMEMEPETEPDLPPEEATPESTEVHCPYCARALADDYRFCPGCGHDTSRVRRCIECGQAQLVPQELEAVYCVHCGQLLD